MRIDLTDFPVIDNHSHPFVVGREPEDYSRNFCIGLLPVSSFDMRNTLCYHQEVNELRRFLNMESASDEEVIAKRYDLIHNNRKEFTQLLLKDVNLTGMLCDYGFPITQIHNREKKLSDAELADFHDDCDCIELYPIDRVEWVANRIMDDEPSFDEFEVRLRSEVTEMVESKHLIALKSIVAYYTGLDIKCLSKEEFRKGYYAYLAERDNHEAEKIFRDYTFILGCEIARDLNIPLQVHTGLGDTPDCNIIKVNPGLLTEALNDSRCKDTKIVLIHGGYPYCEILGFLTNHYQNVYCDISAFIPFASIGCEEKFRSIIEMAPLSKVCYGTDAIRVDTIWYGIKSFKRVFAKVLEDLVNEGYISYQFAIETAHNILHENVKRIYRI